jgi:hypothetical protein
MAPEEPSPASDEHAHHHHHHGAAGDPMVDPLGLEMSRDASGTAWEPDSTPMYMHHFGVGEWMLMAHYNASVAYDDQEGPRGGTQFMSTNWAMVMAERIVSGGQFAGRAMLSLEPLTTGGPAGYPLLLQTGETAYGVPLHDRQHPHNLFMEVAARYRHALVDGLSAELYAAPSGEPALGPAAFPHRISAEYDPVAPITHHWQDSTHISFGVVTLGFYTRRLKLEASWFNGREPGENRYDFQFRPLDSYSVRLSANPDDNASFQVSYGFLKSPEAQLPEQSEQRLTASGTFNRRLGASANWATTVVFGRKIPSIEPPSNSLLLESSIESGPDVIFGRAEYVQKTGSDLSVPGMDLTLFPVGAIGIGYVRNFPALFGVVAGAGVRVAINFVPASLSSLYGGSTPLAALVFLHFRPIEMPGSAQAQAMPCISPNFACK